MQLLSPFHSSYGVAPIDELPSAPGADVRYFPGGSSLGGPDGILVRFASDRCGVWIGVFAFENLSSYSCLSTCPDPSYALVVARGRGYYCDVADQRADFTPAVPVVAVHPVPERRLLLLQDHTALTAYGEAGVLWETERLASDEIKVTSISPTEILGRGWDAPSNAWLDFVIDTATGQARWA